MRVAVVVALVIGISPPAHSQDRVFMGAAASPEELNLLKDWLEETQEVMRSPEFATNIRAAAAGRNSVYIRHENNQPLLGAGSDLMTALNGQAGHRWVGAHVALALGTNAYDASGGWTGLTESDGSQLGSIILPRGNLARWISDDLVERSCAVNTLAHEISHTIAGPQHPTQYWMAFLDGQRREAPAGVASASYLIGTVAQCTWLQRSRRIQADAVSECVAVFGTRHFNSDRCISFADGSAVRPRAGLPPAATD